MKDRTAQSRRGSSGPVPAGRSPSADAATNREHAKHRTQEVKTRGLLMDLPGADGPVEVCVHDQDDWEKIHKIRSLHVKCLEPTCDTLLTAKRMSKSGLRFFAVRSGGCQHNTVTMPVEKDDIAQDPSTLAGGGGPEGAEHLWIKGRLYRIARSLGAEARVEESYTRTDVYLPEHRSVLEYQRWDTDIAARTDQRTAAGAERTIWMFPMQLPDGAPIPSASDSTRRFTRTAASMSPSGARNATMNRDDHGRALPRSAAPSSSQAARSWCSTLRDRSSYAACGH